MSNEEMKEVRKGRRIAKFKEIGTGLLMGAGEAIDIAAKAMAATAGVVLALSIMTKKAGVPSGATNHDTE